VTGDPDARRRALDHVRGLLVQAGATTEEIDQAVADGVLDLLAVDRLLVPAARRYTAAEVAAATGLELELLRRFWRALGFLDVADGDPVFTDLDIRAASLFQDMLRLGATEVDTALELARVIGSSMARIAEAEVVPGTMSPAGDGDDDVLVADAFASIAGETLPAMTWLLEFVWRRHVQVVTRRTMLLRSRGLVAGASPVLAVGFADMVGFTLLSQHLEPEELAAVVRRFDELSHDIVTGLGGRVVKMIGDEAMFVVESVVAGARIGLGLAEAYAHDDLLSDVRVGLAVGPVLVHDGDYFGPTVNMAHRIVTIANPGTVLMTDEVHEQLVREVPGELAGRPLRPRVLKDLGRVQLWKCVRAGQEPGADGDGTGRTGADRRRGGVRWDRMADVLRDLEDLRDAGGRLLASSGRVLRGGRPEAGPPIVPPAGPSAGGEPEGGDPPGP
jgi:adenylate cyclase